MPLRGIESGLNRDTTHHAGFPANPRANQQMFPIRLQLHDLRQVGLQGLSDQPTGLLKDFIEVMGFEGKRAKGCEDTLLLQQGSLGSTKVIFHEYQSQC
jgi:hypothetical protein